MNERLGRKVCDTQDSGDHIVARYHGSYAERKAKGLVNDPGASWIFVVSEGIVVEVTSDVPYGQLGIIEKTKKNKKNRKKKR
ncbi:unnamed protein product [Rhizophagus irregularis]|nr:unnamed protein product [Rhizophagus irregularis]